MAEIINLDHYREHNLGNGAREALIDGLIMSPDIKNGIDEFADYTIAWLWTQGFKIVPLDGNEK